jgi:ankyrin repeat protein
MARIAAFAAVLLFALTQAASANYRWLVDEAYAGNAEGVLRQLEAGLDPNPPTGHEGRSPLLAAATEGHAEIVEILLRHGADTEWRAADGERALVAATRTAYLGGRAETVRLLLDAGSPISSPDDPFGLTPLMRAARIGGDVAVVALLLERGADVRAPSHNGHTALHGAVEDAHGPEIARMLIEAGAEIDAQRTKGRDAPLHLAAARGSADVVALLIGRGARLELRNAAGSTPLHLAAAQAAAANVDLLLAAGADAAITDHAGRSVLDAAIEANAGPERDRAIGLIADRTQDRRRSFALALWRGEEALAERLAGDADVSLARDYLGRSALAAAAGLPSEAWFDRLAADPATVDQFGTEAIGVAAGNGRRARVQRLLALGVPLDGRNAVGATAFLRAAAHGRVGLSLYLLALGADPWLRDHEGRGMRAFMEAATVPLIDEIEQAGMSAAWIDTRAQEAELARLRLAHAAILKVVEGR